MKFSIFKRPQHKVFTHVPIYYNEREEKLKDIEEKALADMGKDTEKDFHERMKGSMRRYQQNHQSGNLMDKNKAEKRRSNIRIIIILAFLFMLAYLLMKHTDTFIEALIKN